MSDHGVIRVNHGDVWRSPEGELRTTLMVCGTSGEPLVSGMDFEMSLDEFLATHEPVSFAYPEPPALAALDEALTVGGKE